jgi:adenylate cyclase
VNLFTSQLTILRVHCLKRFYNCLALFFLSAFCFDATAQVELINEYKSQLKNAGSDSDRVYLLSDLSFAFQDVSIDSSLNYAYWALELSEKMNWKKGEGYACNNLGNIYYFQGDYPAALNYYQKALSANTVAGFNRGIPYNLSNIGLVYFRTKSYREALDFLLRSRKVDLEVNNGQLYERDIMTIGLIYGELKQFDSARYYLEESVQLFRDKDEDMLSASLLNLGKLHTDNKNFDLAEQYYNEAFLLDSNSNDLRRISLCYGGLGGLYMNKLKNAGSEVSEEQKLAWFVISESYLTRAITGLDSLDALYELHEKYRGLYELYNWKGDFQKALHNYIRFDDLRDSIFSEERRLTLARLEYERDLEEKENDILQKELDLATIKNQRYLLIGGAFLLLMLVWFTYRQRKISDKLLFNVLPKRIALRLRKKGTTIADQIENATIIFIDIVGFTRLTENSPPAKTVEMLNNLFYQLDQLAQTYGIEKIKTIGDCYMAASGLEAEEPDQYINMARFALKAGTLIHETNSPQGEKLRFRAGIDCGPVVAGVIGESKFIYDVWGDAVNTASRMESSGVEGEVQITDRFREKLNDQMECVSRGKVLVKGKGEMETWFLKE